MQYSGGGCSLSHIFKDLQPCGDESSYFVGSGCTLDVKFHFSLHSEMLSCSFQDQFEGLNHKSNVFIFTVFSHQFVRLWL